MGQEYFSNITLLQVELNPWILINGGCTAIRTWTDYNSLTFRQLSTGGEFTDILQIYFHTRYVDICIIPVTKIYFLSKVDRASEQDWSRGH